VLGTFDYALDGGDFHILLVDERPKYLETLLRFLRIAGIPFLNNIGVFKKETSFVLYRFTSNVIKQKF
jgi:hypothetical protein